MHTLRSSNIWSLILCKQTEPANTFNNAPVAFTLHHISPAKQRRIAAGTREQVASRDSHESHASYEEYDKEEDFRRQRRAVGAEIAENGVAGTLRASSRWHVHRTLVYPSRRL